MFDAERWQRALATHGVDVASYLGTRPIAARLPWDHIDVGLEEGFLLAEYRKAMKGRASPPCGKVAGMLIHHTNLADAAPDQRRLVCYDCGVACDLTKMRDDRLVALTALGAAARPAARSLPVVDGAGMVDVSERGGGSPGEVSDRVKNVETDRSERVRLAGFVGAGITYTTYRIRFAKVGRAAFLGHHDLARLLARSFRRADLPLCTTRGFNPHPRITFGPALGLGIPSLGELMDVDLEHLAPGMKTWETPADAPRSELAADEVRERLASVCPPGIEIQSCAIVRLPGHPLTIGKAPACAPDAGLGKRIDAVDVLIRPAPDGMAFDSARLGRITAAFLAKTSVPIWRGARTIDARELVMVADVIDGDAATKLAGALDWPDGPLLRVRVSATAEGSAKPAELAKAFGVFGPDDPRAEHALLARLGVVEGAAAAQAAAARASARHVAPPPS